MLAVTICNYSNYSSPRIDGAVVPKLKFDSHTRTVSLSRQQARPASALRTVRRNRFAGTTAAGEIETISVQLCRSCTERRNTTVITAIELS